ncbi:MAG: porin [Rhizobiaceae bacterium]
MKIKSLLIGSAAAIVAATGAQAADAVVVAEPEPVEYVRICDAYGVGFFYIPGTETCLRVSGYVWFQVSTSNDGESGGYYGSTDALGVSSRARLNFDARSDTELGTLRGFIRVQSTWNAANQAIGGTTTGADGVFGTADDVAVSSPLGTDGNATIDQAFIELGGWRLGYTESAWSQTQGGGASNWGSHSWGGMYYGYSQRQLVAYTFQGGNGFFGTISIEDDGDTNYVPDAIVKVGVNQGWGSVWAKVAYDDDVNLAFPPNAGPFTNAPNGNMSGLDGWAASIGTQINIPNSAGSSLRVIGFYSDNRNAYTVGSEYSVLVSYNHAFSSTLSASIAGQWFGNIHGANVAPSVAVPGGAVGIPGTGDGWGAELSIVWFPVTNFEVRTEIHYDDVDTAAGADQSGTTSGILRFTRYF